MKNKPFLIAFLCLMFFTSCDQSINIGMITPQDVEELQPGSTATDAGTQISFNRENYSKESYISLVFGSEVFLRINDHVETLSQTSFKNTNSGFIETFINESYKLVITANSIKSIEDSGLEGYSVIKGELQLFDNENNLLQTVDSFYAEGLY